MNEINELKLLISFFALTFLILFVVAIYATAHEVECKTGDDGPRGFRGDVGVDGFASSGSSTYLLGNTLNEIILAPGIQGDVERLPSVGIPWRSLNNDGDSAVFTFMFNISNVTAEVAKQSQIFFTASSSFTDRPFRSNDTAQSIKMMWTRPTATPPLRRIPNVEILVTRNTSSSLIVTIIQGANWQIIGGSSADISSSNIFVRDLNFFNQDIFVFARVAVPTGSTEKVTNFASTVNLKNE
jgi:hypothetical protein